MFDTWLIVDFDDDTQTFSRVFLTYLDVVSSQTAKRQFNAWHHLQTLCVLSLSWNNEGKGNTWAWNKQFQLVNYPNTFKPLMIEVFFICNEFCNS